MTSHCWGSRPSHPREGETTGKRTKGHRGCQSEEAAGRGPRRQAEEAQGHQRTEAESRPKGGGRSGGSANATAADCERSGAVPDCASGRLPHV